MRSMGGFEGNAQTLRILGRLEQKEPAVPFGSKADDGVGLDLTYRTLASVLKTVSLPSELKDRVAILKHLTYEMVIQSPSLKTVKYRGKDIVTSIFEALDADGGELLLPEDFRRRAGDSDDGSVRSRVICDFIAGMTDRYAVEFYGRLKSDTPQTVFKPL